MSINTKNNLIAIVLIILFVILFMLYSYFSGMQKKVVTDKNGKYLMLNESLIWQKKGNKFVQIKSVPEHFFDYKFTLYHGTSTLKNTIVDSYDTFYSYYDKDYKELKYDDFRGISRNLDVKFPDYKININSSSDDIYLNEILNKYGYNDNNYYSYYVTLDFDNDGTEEILYATTNYSFGSYNSDYHSFFYMVKNDKLSEIIEKE